MPPCDAFRAFKRRRNVPSLSLSLFLYIYIARCIVCTYASAARVREIQESVEIREFHAPRASRFELSIGTWLSFLRDSSRDLVRSCLAFLPFSYDNARVISGPRSALPSSAAQEPPQRARKHGTSFTEAFCRPTLLRFRVIVSELHRRIFLLTSLADAPHERCLVIQSADRESESVALPRSRLQE